MKNLCTALAKAFPHIEAAAKSSNNPHFRSKYADLSAVVDAIKPALIEHDLFFTQATHEVTGGVCVETQIHHASGESMSFGKLFVPANKQDAQGYGSALTYARRYSLMTAFGVPAEDDDGNAAARSAPRADPLPNGKAIDDAQFSHLQALLEASGSDVRRFCQFYEVASVKALPAAKFDTAVRSLEAKIAKQAETAK